MIRTKYLNSRKIREKLERMYIACVSRCQLSNTRKYSEMELLERIESILLKLIDTIETLPKKRLEEKLKALRWSRKLKTAADIGKKPEVTHRKSTATKAGRRIVVRSNPNWKKQQIKEICVGKFAPPVDDYYFSNCQI